MASTIGQLRDALARNVETSGIAVDSKVPQQIEELVAVIRFGGITDYRSTFGRGVWELDLVVDVTVPLSAETADQETELQELLSPDGIRSVPVAIEDDRTLDGFAADLTVSSASEFQTTDIGGTLCLVSSISVHVLAI